MFTYIKKEKTLRKFMIAVALIVCSEISGEASTLETDPYIDGKKVWLVTGASRGLGLEISRAALDAGHQVVATARSSEQVLEKLASYGDRILALNLDVTKPSQAEAVVAEVKARYGRIDVLVNNAGYGQWGCFETVTDEQVRKQFDVNVFGTMNVTRAVLPIMREHRSGYIFTISSGAGIIGTPGASIYTSSKFAVEGLMEGLSGEVKPFGIKTSLLEPGYFRNDFLESSSVVYGQNDISDYAEASSKSRLLNEDMSHKQVGDPAKLGALIVKLSEMDEAPMHLPVGSDSFGYICGKLRGVLSEVESLGHLSISTDSK